MTSSKNFNFSMTFSMTISRRCQRLGPLVIFSHFWPRPKGLARNSRNHSRASAPRASWRCHDPRITIRVHIHVRTTSIRVGVRRGQPTLPGGGGPGPPSGGMPGPSPPPGIRPWSPRGDGLSIKNLLNERSKSCSEFLAFFGFRGTGTSKSDIN